MAEAQSCGQCVHWRKHDHKSANWGDCARVSEGYKTSDQACLRREPPVLVRTPTVYLTTRDVFYCAEFAQKPVVTKPSLVDTVREAARDYAKKLKGEL